MHTDTISHIRKLNNDGRHKTPDLVFANLTMMVGIKYLDLVSPNMGHKENCLIVLKLQTKIRKILTKIH